MSTWEDEIARHLQQAAQSGELRSADGYGKPWAEDAGWDATPPALRMPFKILKNAGIVPAEVQAFHERAELVAKIDACGDAQELRRLQTRLAELQQHLALRLEHLRISGSI